MKKYIITAAQINTLNELADNYDSRILRKIAADLQPIEPLTPSAITSIAYDCNALPEVATDESLANFARAIEAHITGSRS